MRTAAKMIWIIKKYVLIVILIQLLFNTICIRGLSVKKDISPLKAINENRNPTNDLQDIVLSQNAREINSELDNEIIPSQEKHHTNISSGDETTSEKLFNTKFSPKISENSSNDSITENNSHLFHEEFLIQNSTKDSEDSYLLKNIENTKRYDSKEHETETSTVSDDDSFNEIKNIKEFNDISERVKNEEKNKNLTLEIIPLNVRNLKQNVSVSSDLQPLTNENSVIDKSNKTDNSTESLKKNHSGEETNQIKFSQKDMEDLGIRVPNQPLQNNNTKTVAVVLENHINETGKIYLYPGKDPLDVNITFLHDIKHSVAKNDIKIPKNSHEIESGQLGDDNNASQNAEMKSLPSSFMLLNKKVINYEGMNANISLRLRQDNNSWLLTLYFEDSGEKFDFILNSLQPSAFPRDVLIFTENSDTTESHHLSDILKNLEIYEGKAENKISYAIGTIINSTFFGTVMLSNGKIICIEPSEEFQQINNITNNNFLNYKTLHVHLDPLIQMQHTNYSNNGEIFSKIYYCKFDGEKKIFCFIDSSTNEFVVQDSSISSNKNLNKTSFPPLDMNLGQNIKCSIELISHPSHFEGVHGKNKITALREMIQIAQLSNRIFTQIDLNDDGVSDNLNLQIENIVLQSTETSVDSQERVKKYMDKFRKRKSRFCMSLVFVHSIEKGEPVSYTYDGGICKSNEIDSELSSNIALLNTAFSNQENGSLFLKSFILTKTIGNLFGSMHSECNKVLEATSSGDWNNLFSKCEKRNIATYLTSEGNCLPKVEDLASEELKKNETTKSLCGNGKVDEGEECDCESIETCKAMSSCCVPPGQKNECQYNRKKGYECEWTDICCNKDCKLIPESWRFFCGQGEPSCSPINSFCDGLSPKCPVNNEATKTFDGQRCWPGPFKNEGTNTCDRGFCNSTICRDAGLLDCKCPSSTGKECRVCCQKSVDHGLCVPAEHHGLRSKSSQFFYRHKGTPCQELISGECDEYGQCSAMKLESSAQSILFIQKHYVKKLPLSLTITLSSIMFKIFVLKLFV